MTDEAAKNLNTLAEKFNDAVDAALKRQNVHLIDLLDFEGLCDFEDAVGSIAVGHSPYSALIAELDTMQPLRIANFFAGVASKTVRVKFPALPAAMTDHANADFYRRNDLPVLAGLCRA